MRAAILIDGGFFLKRHHRARGAQPPAEAAKDLYTMCFRHLAPSKAPNQTYQQNSGERSQLYRILYYDCPPLMHKAHYPVSKNPIDYAKTPVAKWRLEFHEQLRKKRKIALRLGYINERSGRWILKKDAQRRLLAGEVVIADLNDDDFVFDVRQKGVDMRIGIDIASIAYKRQADQIVLIAGDSDFVPAAKLARREGIDFVLDPMWANIRADLHEHIDGLRSVIPRPGADPISQ